MRNFFKNNLYFYLPYFVALGIAFIFHIMYSKQEVTLFVNSHYTYFFDTLFKYLTFLGDGWFFFAVSLLLFFKNRQYGVFALSSFAISTLIAQGLKHLVFNDHLRPIMILKEVPLHVVAGVEIHEYNSFPSGHSTSAFALCCLLALLVAKPRYKIILLFIALITAFSRIYLLQHFLEDTIAGSIIGVTTSTLLFGIFIRNKWIVLEEENQPN